MTPFTIILDAPAKKDRAIKIIQQLSLEKVWDVAIKPYVPKRSTTANARLWALHSLAGESTGNSAEDMHEWALCRFFGYEEKKVGGIVRCIPLERSSTKDKKRFAEFMEATESWYVTEFGVFLGDDR